MSARPLAASVAPLALSDDERSTKANNQLVENPRWDSYVLVTPGNNDAPCATGAASAQHDINWCAEVTSEMGIFSVATRSSWRTHPA